MQEKPYAVIMAGGIGSRFWPMSRAQHPKQFHDVLSNGRTLIQATFDRLTPVVPVENIFVVTHVDYTHLVKEQLPELCPGRILAEPVGKNTAPCLMYALSHINRLNPKAPIVATPADHRVNQVEDFQSDLEIALQSVSEHAQLMTIGIPPSRPETGYGYIQFVKNKKPDVRVYPVKTFTEKPNREMAEAFVESREFLWNSGILCARADVLTEAFKTHMADLHDLFIDLDTNDASEVVPQKVKEAYLESSSISIDYGILEKSENVYVIAARFDWNDLGTWSSIYPYLPKDFLKNASDGQILVLNAERNLIKTPKDKLTVVLGVSDLIVVDTGDVLLVCPRSEEQSLREIVSMLRANKDKYADFL